MERGTPTLPAPRSLFASAGERRAREALQAVEDKWDVRVHLKTSVADALGLRGRERLVGSSDYSFALRAHFDFLVTSGEDERPKFALEFDGSQHETDPVVAARDRRKDGLAKRFSLPLLRTTGDCLAEVQPGTTLLEFLLDYWLERTFDEQLETGMRKLPLSLGDAARVTIRQLFARGECALPSPVWISSPVQQQTTDWYAEVYSVLPLPCRRRVVIGYGRCSRDHCRTLETPYSSLAVDLADFDAATRLQRVAAGLEWPPRLGKLRLLNLRTEGWSRFGHSPQCYEEAEEGSPISWYEHQWLKPHIDPDGEPWDEWFDPVEVMEDELLPPEYRLVPG